jgi:hypothetical protein
MIAHDSPFGTRLSNGLETIYLDNSFAMRRKRHRAGGVTKGTSVKDAM